MFPQIAFFMALGVGLLAPDQPDARPELHIRREAPSDLEVTGMIHGVAPGASRFLSREFLVGLPQMAGTIQKGEEFDVTSNEGLRVTGIYLDVLRKSLGVEDAATSMAAICIDGYTSTFPSEYVEKHRPILVLSVEGLTPHDWAMKNHGYDAGPYFIGYQNFVPSFRVLAHVDRPQEPDGLTKIIFGTEGQLLGGIAPKDHAGAAEASELDGYRIARQNCYRCHNSGNRGGTKAGVSWSDIGSIAKSRPDYFAAWVHDPQAIRPKSRMPPNKDYDKATLLALQRYFAPFAAEAQ